LTAVGRTSVTCAIHTSIYIVAGSVDTFKAIARAAARRTLVAISNTARSIVWTTVLRQKVAFSGSLEKVDAATEHIDMACISLEGLNIIGIGSGNNSSATDQFAAIIGGRGSGGGRKAEGGDKENEGGGELHGWIGRVVLG
jgi:hypothetical protein